jgi:hypothetical protein
MTKLRDFSAGSRAIATRSPAYFVGSLVFLALYPVALWPALFVVQSWFITYTYDYLIPRPDYYIVGYRRETFWWFTAFGFLTMAWLGAVKVQRAISDK